MSILILTKKFIYLVTIGVKCACLLDYCNVQCVTHTKTQDINLFFFQFTNIIEDCTVEGNFVPGMRKDHFWMEGEGERQEVIGSNLLQKHSYKTEIIYLNLVMSSMFQIVFTYLTL